MAETRVEDSSIGTKTKPAALDLTTSSHDDALVSSTSAITPNRRKWPGTPTKVMKPIPVKVHARQVSLQLSEEELQRKATNTSIANTNAGIAPMNFEFGRDVLSSKSDDGKSGAKKALLSPLESEFSAATLMSPKKGQIPNTMNKRNRVPVDDEFRESTEYEHGDLGSDNIKAPVFPSVVFGEKETVGLSKVQRADREVKRWEEVLKTHEEHNPSAVSFVKERLQIAKDARASIDESLEENTRVGDINPGKTAINERLKALEWGLSTSKFNPEKENIKCAISGYNSGLITYSSHFTIIYAGHIVDTAPDYGSFVLNRNARLDKYCALHGPGWMWYEAPLNTPPDSQPRLLPGVALQRGPSWSGLEPYFVNQGFWKRAGFVSRMPVTAGNRPVPQEQTFQFNEQGQVFCQNNQGPLLVFRTLLDSGATFPSLPMADFASLGVDMMNYGAQSITTILHAVGESHVRVYEMSVCVTDNECRNLVIVDDAVWPNSFKYLGSFMPVIAHNEPPSIDEQGREIVMRISGLMPFLACYVSSTPTEPYIYLGEDRNDVLGAHRMPGQRKWAVEMGYPKISDAIASEKFGNPKITFNHRGGMVIDLDEDHRKHASQIHVTLPDGRTDIKYICPADMIAADRVNRMAQTIPVPSNQGPFEAGGGGIADDILPQSPYMGAAEGSPGLPRQ